MQATPNEAQRVDAATRNKFQRRSFFPLVEEKEKIMRFAAIGIAAALALSSTFALAQTTSVGGSSTTSTTTGSTSTGTTGLGAGSLLFKSVLDYLFGIGGGRPRLRRNPVSGDLRQNESPQKS